MNRRIAIVMVDLFAILVFILLSLPHKPEAKTAENAPPPGNVIVEIVWSAQANADVDLWVQAPTDRPVGYSNKGGRIFNLLRDDLGANNDITQVNYEVSFSRGIPEGEYTVNLHLYRVINAPLPLAVSVKVSVAREIGGDTREIFSQTAFLGHPGEEITVVRFSLDGGGNLVPGSIHDIPRPLRAAP